MTLQSGRATEFEKHRAKLWRIAYRMLGSQAVTLIREGHVPDHVYEAVREHFSEAELVDLSLAIVAINGWNRVSIAFRAEAGSYQVPDKTARGVA
jgi:hypothetical protein